MDANAVSWLERETVLAGKAIGNLQLALLGAGLVLLAVLTVLLLRRRKPADINPPAVPQEPPVMQDQVAPATPVSPVMPVMPADMAPASAAGKTVAVRGMGAVSSANPSANRDAFKPASTQNAPAGANSPATRDASRPAPTQSAPVGVNPPVNRDAFKPAPMQSAPAGANPPVSRDVPVPAPARSEGRQISSFAPSAAPAIDVMCFDCTLSDGQRMHVELERPSEVTIGRDSGNSIVLADPSVSGHHARLICAGPEVILENISPVRDGQRNRLCLERRELGSPMPLRSGAHLTLGTAAVTVTWTMLQAAPADMTQRAAITLLEVAWTLEDGRSGRQAVKLAGTVSIGRDSQDDVTIPDPGVSRKHLLVSLEQGGLMLRNGSLDKGQGRNPFYCGGQAVYDQTPYQPGQDIYAGHATIRLRLVR